MLLLLLLPVLVGQVCHYRFHAPSTPSGMISRVPTECVSY